MAYDKQRAIGELDRELANGNIEDIATMCSSHKMPKVGAVLCSRAQILWNLDPSGLDPDHLGKLYEGLARVVPPPNDSAWFLRKIAMALDGTPNNLTLQMGKLQRYLAPEVNAEIATDILARFQPGKRLTRPQISTLCQAADNGWKPDSTQLETLRSRVEQNLGEGALIASKRSALQVENVMLMALLSKLPESSSWKVHGRPLARELFDRLIESPGARVGDADAFGEVIGRDADLMGELLNELASGKSTRAERLYLFLARHGSSLQLAVRAPRPEGDLFEKVGLYVAEAAAYELLGELPGMAPPQGLEAVRTYQGLWKGMDQTLLIRSLERLKISEAIGRLALESDFLIAAVASREAPELEEELLGKIRELSFPADSAEATELARLRALHFTRELGQTPRDRRSLLAFYAAQADPSPLQRREWLTAWGDLEGAEAKVLGRLEVEPATARALLERDRLQADILDLATALNHDLPPEKVSSLLAANELGVLIRLLKEGCSREDACIALNAYRGHRESGLDDHRSFLYAIGSLVGAPSSAAHGSGLSVNSHGLVVGGTFLRKRL